MWFDRDKEELIGSAKGAPEDIPNFRPFDMLAEPNQSLVVLQNQDMRVGVENVSGTQPAFRRNSDYDTLYFQFAGRTTIETEYGVFEQQCGELLLVPEGIAQRSTGSADSLRLFVHLREPIEPLYSAEKHHSHTEFEMVRTGGPGWAAPSGPAAPPAGKVVEQVYLWDRAEPTTVQRDTAYLIGKATEGRGVTHYRVFDIFHEMTGKRGPGPMLAKSSTFFCEVYNTEGEQFAFHRALDSVEAALPVKTLATGIALRDQHMRHYVFTTSAGEVPDLRFEVASAFCPGVLAGREVTCKVSGNLSIRGVPRSFSMTLKIREANAASAFRVGGDGVVKLSDYGIEPPSQFGVKTANEIQIHLEVTETTATAGTLSAK